MEIKDIFVRPIDRSLEGVIKADALDDATVKQELDEYVVTDELKKHFAKFFHAYADSIGKDTEKMGVWISGFFGSGKSHFLKILSYLLENREIDGRHAVDFFDADRKISDPMVIANIHRSESIPTDVILFNIDAKSSKQQGEDSLLDVFIRVFMKCAAIAVPCPMWRSWSGSWMKKGGIRNLKTATSKAPAAPGWMTGTTSIFSMTMWWMF